MNDLIFDFVRARQIDSFQKLRFLLFLHQHPDLIGTSQQFAEQLYLGDVLLLDRIIRELQKVGLVACVDNRCRLHDQPEIRSCLQFLARAFEDPTARQTILDQVKNRPVIDNDQLDHTFCYGTPHPEVPPEPVEGAVEGCEVL